MVKNIMTHLFCADSNYFIKYFFRYKLNKNTSVTDYTCSKKKVAKVLN